MKFLKNFHFSSKTVIFSPCWLQTWTTPIFQVGGLYFADEDQVILSRTATKWASSCDYSVCLQNQEKHSNSKLLIWGTVMEIPGIWVQEKTVKPQVIYSFLCVRPENISSSFIYSLWSLFKCLQWLSSPYWLIKPSLWEPILALISLS